MATILQNETLLKEHAKVILGYIGVFAFTVGVQLYAKVHLELKHKKAKKEAVERGEDPKNIRINRYTTDDLIILSTDRSVMNFIEFAPAFMGLFVTHAAVVGDCTKLGWYYVGLRVLYPFLAMNGGITHRGPRPLIFLATFPMYGILGMLASGIYKKVY